MKLSINIDHIATLRNARGGSEPDPVRAAAVCEEAGADGIVVHLREDRRHIRDADVHALRRSVKTRLDLEMGASEEIIGIALQVVPDLVTLVPEKRQELTTEGGLDVAAQRERLRTVTARFHANGIPVSLFVNPEREQIDASRDTGADMIELHTGEYAEAPGEPERLHQLQRIREAARYGASLGLGVNAGHGLNYVNVSDVAAVAEIGEMSIGHAVIARAAFTGLDRAVREMLALVRR